MINDSISKGPYVTEELKLTELKSFQNFIYRIFKKHEKYKEMRPTSNCTWILMIWNINMISDTLFFPDILSEHSINSNEE